MNSAIKEIVKAKFIPTIQKLTKQPRQSFIGLVIGDKMQSTLKVRVAKEKLHPIVQKVSETELQPVIKHRNFLCRINPSVKAIVGDLVRINSMKSKSKLKNFYIAEIITECKRFVDSETGKVYTQDYEKQKKSLTEMMKIHGKL